MSDLYLASQRILQAFQKRGKTQVSRAKMPPKVNLRAIEVASGSRVRRTNASAPSDTRCKRHTVFSTPRNLKSLFARDSTPRFYFLASSSPHLRKSWISMRKIVFLITPQFLSFPHRLCSQPSFHEVGGFELFEIHTRSNIKKIIVMCIYIYVYIYIHLISVPFGAYLLVCQWYYLTYWVLIDR